MAGYTANGVLLGLHYHKMGQYRNLVKVTVLAAAILIVVIGLAIPWGDGGHKASRLTYWLYPSLTAQVNRASVVPPSPSSFRIGRVGKAKIVGDVPDCSFLLKDLPESGPWRSLQHPAPGVFHSVDSFPGAHPIGPLSLDPDFGLPDPPPLWAFALKGLPAGITHESIALSRPPQAILTNPTWPARVWLVDDTAVVEGLLTFHAHGLLSFELLSETHPGLGFAGAVRSAIDQSICFPSVDRLGNRITVSCRYRCLFFQGGQSSVSVGASITARIKKD